MENRFLFYHLLFTTLQVVEYFVKSVVTLKLLLSCYEIKGFVLLLEFYVYLFYFFKNGIFCIHIQSGKLLLTVGKNVISIIDSN